MSTFPTGWSRPESPFHPGELAIQERVGMREKIDAQARRASIREAMPDQHRGFFESLPFLMVGTVDAAGQPWASILVGEPGFIRSPDATHLRIEAVPLPGDPLGGTLVADADIGLLGIELPTRRRNRMNGTIAARSAAGVTVEVRQSFGNCPKYIQARDLCPVERPNPPPVQARGHLDSSDRATVARADTFFIATANERADAGAGRGVDVSHRGGKPGFVRVRDDGTLSIPDFIGNFLFNTLGNLLVEPRAGLLFPDFDTGDLLWIAGEGTIVWDGPEVDAFAGAERILHIKPTQIIRQNGVLPLRGTAAELSPALNRTGAWAY